MISGGSSVFTNTLITGNTANNLAVGGLFIMHGSPKFVNVTIAGNYSTNKRLFDDYTDEAHSGIFILSGETQIHNSIVWGNNGGGINIGTYNPLNIKNSLIEGVLSKVDRTTVYSDPLFYKLSVPDEFLHAKTDGDYRLKPGSLFINGGENSLNDEPFDLAGHPRIQGGTIDVGAYELGGIFVVAVNDRALTTINMPVMIDVLANDNFGGCAGNSLTLNTVAGNGPRHGVLTITGDNRFVYTPNTDYFGIDSIDYEISCGGNISWARVYILTQNPLSKEYHACSGVVKVMGFANVPEVYYNWYDKDKNLIKSLSDTIKRVKNNTGAVQTYYAQPRWKSLVFPFDTVKLYPAPNREPEVRDIRLLLCPVSTHLVQLTSYLDSLDYPTVIRWGQDNGSMSAFSNVSTGELNTDKLSSHGIYTYPYTRYSECSTDSAVGKAYVYVPHGKLPSHPDTVLICRTQNPVVNVNSIFGLELGGEWYYGLSTDQHPDMNPDEVVVNKTKKIDPPSKFAGAIFFNADQAFETVRNDSNYNGSYKGIAGKKFVFEYYGYSTNNCVTETKPIRIVIVVHN
jgi:hypothetical protein